MATETPREPVYLPGYKLGDQGKPDHFAASTSRDTAGIEAGSLELGDAAFIKRSDLKWSYAIVTEKLVATEEVTATTDAAASAEGSTTATAATILRFEVDKDKNRKSFPAAQWGKYIRVIKVEESELAKLKEDEAAAKKTDEEAAAAINTEEPVKTEEPVTTEEAEEQAATEAPAAAPVVASSGASIGGESTKSTKSKQSTGGSSKLSTGGSSWFSGIFKKSSDNASAITQATKNTSKPSAVAEGEEEEDKAAADSAESAAAQEKLAENPVETPVGEAMIEDPAAAALAATSFPEASQEPTAALAVDTALKEEPHNDQENSDPIKLTLPALFLPSPKVADTAASVGSKDSKDSTGKDKVSSLRIPLMLKPSISLKKTNSRLNKLFTKNKDKGTLKEATIEESPQKTVVISSPPSFLPPASARYLTSPKIGDEKQWFDPDACEVDYDKSATDLFQALEARQFDYAQEMYIQVPKVFTKECKTWVVARGEKKKDSQLRFRALPLHAALVFGAPDDMVLKILRAYPKGTRGRDVKGRLPIHLAMEHNASEIVVSSILEAFPKGFFAKDKKDMAPLDYVNGNMERAHMKHYLPLLTAAKVEDERIKWEVEKEESLRKQKEVLKNDPVYMEDAVEKVTENVENAYVAKMGLLESNYQKEIELLKKKHDSETQALLEGFEVKLNFERKLLKLKAKA